MSVPCPSLIREFLSIAASLSLSGILPFSSAILPMLIKPSDIVPIIISDKLVLSFTLVTVFAVYTFPV